MFQYQLTNQITGTVEQVHFNRKMYDTTGGSFNTGVFIVTQPGYYQFTCSLSSESSNSGINYYLQRNRSTVASGIGRLVPKSIDMMNSKESSFRKSYSRGSLTITLKLNNFDMVSVKKEYGEYTRNWSIANYFEGRRIA